MMAPVPLQGVQGVRTDRVKARQRYMHAPSASDTDLAAAASTAAVLAASAALCVTAACCRLLACWRRMRCRWAAAARRVMPAAYSTLTDSSWSLGRRDKEGST